MSAGPDPSRSGDEPTGRPGARRSADPRTAAVPARSASLVHVVKVRFGLTIAVAPLGIAPTAPVVGPGHAVPVNGGTALAVAFHLRRAAPDLRSGPVPRPGLATFCRFAIGRFPAGQVGLPPEGTAVTVALWGLAVALGMAWPSIGGIRIR